jgi:hypothetical protein
MGVLRNAEEYPLSKATLILIKANDTLSTLSNEDGSFEFKVPGNGEWNLNISMKGYKTIQNKLIVPSGIISITLPTIVLSTEYQQLDPVTVIRSKPIRIVEDTVEYQASAYKLQFGAELEQLMKQLPGIDWDTAGNVVIQGQVIKHIMVNGQDFSGNIKSLLENLPADIIEKVQVIDDYGDKARLTGVKINIGEKVLNIVIKQDKNNGAVANLGIGVGDQQKYTSQLFSNAFLGDQQISLNGKLNNSSVDENRRDRLLFFEYNDKISPKLLIGLRTSTAGTNILSNQEMNQITYFTQNQITEQQNAQNKTNNNDNYVSCNINYIPTSYTKLKFSTYLHKFNNHQSSSTNFDNLEQDSLFSKNINGESQVSGGNHGFESLSKFYIEKTSSRSNMRWSFESSYDNNSEWLNQNNQNNSIVSIEDSLYNQILQQNLQNSKLTKEILLKLNSYFPIGKTALLEFGYSWNHSSVKYRQISYGQDSTIGSVFPSESNSTNYSSQSLLQSVYAGYLIHSGRLNLSLEMNAQPFDQSGKISNKQIAQNYSYFNIYPGAQFSYNFSIDKKFVLNYGSNMVTPSIQQLNPIIDRSDPQYPVLGNPTLKPSLVQTASLHYLQTGLHSKSIQTLNIGITYTRSQNLITPEVLHPQDTGIVIQETTFLNANGSNNLKIEYTLDLPSFFHKWVRVATQGNLTIANTPLIADSIRYSTSSLIWSHSFQIRLDIPRVLESSLSVIYNRSLSHYSSGPNVPFLSSSLFWQFDNHIHLSHNWLLTSSATQTLIKSSTKELNPTSLLLNISIQQTFLFHKNQTKLILSGNNLFSQYKSDLQNISPNSIGETHIILPKRFYLLSVLINFRKFK